ncbi:hypothetical protein THF1A12_770005 [Vibrio jasicida]|uniref:Uncharacterized protein n=1 Tax=Vibrio jasicida TaxID=766224 RepID=A0AAU9QZE4_9VIBR|nr:hypothetical protein THF1A12_770005 [Vibrio jasicida]
MREFNVKGNEIDECYWVDGYGISSGRIADVSRRYAVQVEQQKWQ